MLCINCGKRVQRRQKKAKSKTKGGTIAEHLYCASCLRAEDMEVDHAEPYPHSNALGNEYRHILGYSAGQSRSDQGDDGDDL